MADCCEVVCDQALHTAQVRVCLTSLGFHATQSVGHAECCALGDALPRACNMLLL